MVSLCPVTGLDIEDTQMILFQACGSDMDEKVKFDGEKTKRHDFATKRITGLTKALLDGDNNGVDVLYCGKECVWERIKDSNSAEAISRRTTLDGKVTNLAKGLRSCLEKHKDYCANNDNHMLTTIVILTSGKTSNHSFSYAESEGKEELRTVIKEIADSCQNPGSKQIRVVFAPVAPDDSEQLFLNSLCNPTKRIKLIATQISILHPLDRESVMRMATVYDKNVGVAH